MSLKTIIVNNTIKVADLTVRPVIIKMGEEGNTDGIWQTINYLDFTGQFNPAIAQQIAQVIRSNIGDVPPGVLVSAEMALGKSPVSSADVLVLYFIKSYKFSTATVLIQLNAEAEVSSEMMSNTFTADLLKKISTSDDSELLSLDLELIHADGCLRIMQKGQAEKGEDLSDKLEKFTKYFR